MSQQTPGRTPWMLILAGGALTLALGALAFVMFSGGDIGAPSQTQAQNEQNGYVDPYIDSEIQAARQRAAQYGRSGGSPQTVPTSTTSTTGAPPSRTLPSAVAALAGVWEKDPNGVDTWGCTQYHRFSFSGTNAMRWDFARDDGEWELQEEGTYSVDSSGRVVMRNDRTVYLTVRGDRASFHESAGGPSVCDLRRPTSAASAQPDIVRRLAGVWQKTPGGTDTWGCTQYHRFTFSTGANMRWDYSSDGSNWSLQEEGTYTVESSGRLAMHTDRTVYLSMSGNRAFFHESATGPSVCDLQRP